MGGIWLRELGPKFLRLTRSVVKPTGLVQMTHPALTTQLAALSDHILSVESKGPPEGFPFAVKGLSHIAMAVPDLALAVQHYQRAFGAEVSAPIEKVDQGVTVVFVRLPNLCIELLHPLGEKSTVARFLQRNPKGGIHHLCLAVDDVTAAANYLNTEAGVSTVGSSTPTIGAEGKPVIFLSPKDNIGVLMELEQADETVSTTIESPRPA